MKYFFSLIYDKEIMFDIKQIQRLRYIYMNNQQIQYLIVKFIQKNFFFFILKERKTIINKKNSLFIKYKHKFY